MKYCLKILIYSFKKIENLNFFIKRKIQDHYDLSKYLQKSQNSQNLENQKISKIDLTFLYAWYTTVFNIEIKK